MKVLCPKCDKSPPVELKTLEANGMQMARCAKCNVSIHATYEEKKGREYWEIQLEKPAPERKKDPPAFPEFLKFSWWLLKIVTLLVILYNALRWFY